MRSFFAVAVLAVTAALFVLPVSAQSGGIKGRVRNQQGKGIPNATITARQDGKDIKSSRSDGKGDFVMTGIRPGIYNIAFDAPGYSTGILYNVEIKNSTRDLGGRLILSIDRGTLVIVRSSVFFREGTSVTGAKVELFEVGADGELRRLATAYTTVSGEVTFRRPDRKAKLRVTASYKGVSASKDIEVEGAAAYGTAITLDISREQR